MKKAIIFLGKILQIIFPMRIIENYLSFKRILFTGYYSNSFKKFGSNSVIKSQFHAVGNKFISIGNNVSIGERVCITAWNKSEYLPEIIIGNNVDIGDDCHITAINKIKIGNNVLFGKKITISDNSHGSCDNNEELKLHPSQRVVTSKGEVIINDNVWIGDKATILPNITIGKGAIVGANSVVTKNVPNHCIVAGNPAKIIKILN